ncbi:MAG: aminodeoxychorismate synthase component I [Nevskiaceae bacterium]|nr:MAG: aminodeoxychorismate synthase component I [Nevskiaceae bacterium]
MNNRAERIGAVDLFALHRQHPQRYPFLLQSVAGHPVSGRYDILFAFPETTETLIGAAAFFSQLTERFLEARIGAAGDLPFVGGWFLYLGYEAAGHIEPRLRLPGSPHRWPNALAVRCTGAAIYDRSLGVTHLVAERGREQLQTLQRDLESSINNTIQDTEKNKIISDVSADDPERFLSGVEQIHRYLAEGDTFQVNLSRGWRARLAAGVDYQDVYAQLRLRNPAPFAGLACWQNSAILSSSPERLVRFEDGVVETRPIAGTRPRGQGEAEDLAQRSHLMGSLKERAEHVMLIDLERNDLGRVCEPGSIEVSELMTMESYAHVHHIVSNIRGRLKPRIGPAEILKAVFPGGTITGCPKVRAMEIIAELEGVGRGPYTGAMGYLSRCGRMDSNILIRSLVCEDEVASFRAGAGIVADSVAAAELAETNAKARGLLLALGAAD